MTSMTSASVACSQPPPSAAWMLALHGSTPMWSQNLTGLVVPVEGGLERNADISAMRSSKRVQRNYLTRLEEDRT